MPLLLEVFGAAAIARPAALREALDNRPQLLVDQVWGERAQAGQRFENTHRHQLIEEEAVAVIVIPVFALRTIFMYLHGMNGRRM